MLKGWVNKWEAEGLLVFQKLEYGVRVKVDKFYVTPFRGKHTGNVGENSAMYLIELPDGRTLFYGLDSAAYYSETMEALRNYFIDIFISEATFGIRKVVHPGHMCLENVREVICGLFEQGTLGDDSVVYLTHINHSSSHDEMLEAVEKMSFPVSTFVAYDGLKIL